MYFPPYIAPPCQLPCCRPQSIPRYPPIHINQQLSLAAVRSLTPPHQHQQNPPIPPTPKNILTNNPSQSYQNIRPSSSLPNGVFDIDNKPSQLFATPPSQHSIKLQSLRNDQQFIRTSQPNLFQSFGKSPQLQQHQYSLPPPERVSMSNLNQQNAATINKSNLLLNGGNNHERRTTPYYYNDLYTTKASSSVFDSNLNLRGYNSEDHNSTTTNSKEELVDDVETLVGGSKYICDEQQLNDYNNYSGGIKKTHNNYHDDGGTDGENIIGGNFNELSNFDYGKSNGFVGPIPATRSFARNVNA